MKLTHSVDIVIPVYNEGESIGAVLHSLNKHVSHQFKVFICYDHDGDTTLPAVRQVMEETGLNVSLVQNRGEGVLGAIRTGMAESSAEAVIVFPADDTFNAVIIDRMIADYAAGSDIVAASRFMRGGCMKGCRPSKAILVRSAALLLHRIAGLPTHDPTNGFRLFSRKVITKLPIESQQGWSFSLELLVKSHRLKWRISEIPASWFERKEERSRFQILKWAPEYLRWFFYAFETAFLRKQPETTADIGPFMPAATVMPEKKSAAYDAQPQGSDRKG